MADEAQEFGHSLDIHLELPPDPDGNPGERFRIPWQTGPVKLAGVNGIQADDVLEQVSLYLRSFLPSAESGEPLTYGQERTHAAVSYIGQALWHLRERTRERYERGVEGTSAP